MTLSIETDRPEKKKKREKCRPRSDAAECGIWLESTLFASLPAVLDTSIASKIYLFKF